LGEGEGLCITSNHYLGMNVTCDFNLYEIYVHAENMIKTIVKPYVNKIEHSRTNDRSRHMPNFLLSRDKIDRTNY
jgi:hypothetical protein